MMLRNGWHMGALTLGVMLALTLAASAGNDTVRLDAKKSNTALASAGFTHDARAQANDDDVEDVNFRYSRGYYRGSYGTGYYFPRAYAFRSGYWNGYYGSGYYGYGYGRGYYGYSGYYGYRPSYSCYYSPSYYYSAPVYYSQPVYYSAPVVGYYYPCDGVATASSTLALPSRPPMALADEPPRAPATQAPQKRQPTADVPYPYDGPATPQPARPSYRYDGGPNQAVPMPPAEASPSGTSPKASPSDGRVVKVAANKKIAYPAYGDHRKSAADDTTRTVKQTRE